MAPDSANAVAAFGALAFSIITAWRLERRDAKRLTVQLFAELSDRLRDLPGAASTYQASVLAAYGPAPEEGLDAPARAYLGFLDALDRFAVALDAGVLDARLARQYVATLTRDSELVNKKFLADFRSLCRDPDVYRDMERLVARQRSHPAAS